MSTGQEAQLKKEVQKAHKFEKVQVELSHSKQTSKFEVESLHESKVPLQVLQKIPIKMLVKIMKLRMKVHSKAAKSRVEAGSVIYLAPKQIK